MNQNAIREQARKLKKKLKKMSLNQVERFVFNIFTNAGDEVAIAFKEELHEQFGIGEKRFKKLLIGVNKRLRDGGVK
ncbi:hypothetical protein WG909_13030 [Peptostreptococcaceae bacterium AGR-M142]